MPDTEQQEAPVMPGESTPTTEIVRHVAETPALVAPGREVMSDDEIRRSWRVASALAASGMFKDTYQAERAFAKILIGRDLGISPTQALMTIDLVEGAVQMRGVLLAGFLRRHPTYDYRIEGEHTDETCTVVIERQRDGEWRDVGSWTFTVEDARKAQLLKDDKPKAAWTAHRKNMLMWRAMANAVRAHAPDVFGGVPVYVDDEIQRRPELTQGVGSGAATGVDLGPEVEKVLARAAELGHAGLADRATAEMTLGDQPPGVLVEWCQRANAELDEMEPAEADVVEPEGEEVDAEPEAPQAAPARDAVEAVSRAETMRGEALRMLEEADAAEADGDDERAENLRGEAASIEAEAEAIAQPEQESLDL